MLTNEDLGLSCSLPAFCQGCQVSELTIKNNLRYANNMLCYADQEIICEHRRVCESLYERLKKEDKT